MCSTDYTDQDKQIQYGSLLLVSNQKQLKAQQAHVTQVSTLHKHLPRSCTRSSIFTRPLSSNTLFSEGTGAKHLVYSVNGLVLKHNALQSKLQLLSVEQLSQQKLPELFDSFRPHTLSTRLVAPSTVQRLSVGNPRKTKELPRHTSSDNLQFVHAVQTRKLKLSSLELADSKHLLLISTDRKQ